ncbi:MAG: hypothetical protein LBR55_01170 [Bacteroidales bacterium]|jgi:hypothetical protein|nr:hypothetical protein [Bacteroidales bacterium]
MKKIIALLCVGTLLSVACNKQEPKNEPGTQASNIRFTACKSTDLKGDELPNVDVQFTTQGVEITYPNFAVTCDFTDVKVTHTFVNGALRITQKGTPHEANCVCYTDVSYTIDGIVKDEVNVIFINGEQVYCHNEDCSVDLNIGKTTEIKSGNTACNAPYDLSLQVVSVNDGRCPEGVTCFWEGEATVEFQLVTKSGKHTFILSEHPRATNDTIIEGFKYQLKNVTPYPVHGEEQLIKTVEILITQAAGDCDPHVIINEEEYCKVPEFRNNISNLRIESDTLKFTITASGCSGKSWGAQLITTGAIKESNPPQRPIQLSFVNPEACLAVISKEFLFNIKCLQVEGHNSVSLNIEGESISYEY